MLRLYASTASLALRRAAKAWPVAFSLVLYAAVLLGGSILLRPLGIVGGIVLSLAAAACFASYLHLLSVAVAGSRLTMADVKEGFRARFWDVVSVLFALWILSFVSGILVSAAGEKGPAVAAIIGLAMAFFFNAVPELLYLGRSRSFALLGDSAKFVLANPLAWLLPNLVFAAALLAPSGALRVARAGELLLVFQRVFSPTGAAAAIAALPIVAIPVVLLLFHYAMVFRGLLFLELSSSSSRLRAFRARQ